MKIDLYNLMMSRRGMLKGAAGAAAMAAVGGPALSVKTAFAQDDLRAAILKIPGVGKGQPTDADWQKVGEMCLGPTKQNIQEGEFKGVERSAS